MQGRKPQLVKILWGRSVPPWILWGQGKDEWPSQELQSCSQWLPPGPRQPACCFELRHTKASYLASSHLGLFSPPPLGVGGPQGLQLSNQRGQVPSFFTAIPTSHLSKAFPDGCCGIRTLVKHVLKQWLQPPCSQRPQWYKMGRVAAPSGAGGSRTPKAHREWWWARGHLPALSTAAAAPKGQLTGVQQQAFQFFQRS